jgi:hypothetical protein
MIHRHSDGTEEWMAAFKDNEGWPLAILSQVGKSYEKMWRVNGNFER